LHEHFLSKVQEKDITIDLILTLQDNEDKILVDEKKFVQIVNNLINNALKFTLHGNIKFGYTLKNNEIELFVEDTGIGIPPHMHDEIFKRFRQVETTAHRQFGGSGLGLSISKAFVELLGGRIWLRSEMGIGTTFYFTIPYKKVQNIDNLQKQTSDSLEFEIKETKTVLIAEDEDSNFILLKEILSDMNINIFRALNGIEAIEICRSSHIDLILMDIKMPIMDGYEATKQIREFMPDVPIIAQTAYSTLEDKNKALACGCNEFISKPMKQAFLISKIKEQFSKV
jgi:CheY-like chemotaxis protein